MAIKRLTLKLSDEEIRDIKKQAIDRGESVADHIVNNTVIYDFNIIPQIKLRVQYADLVAIGSDFYRIDVEFLESKSDRWLRNLWYEIWVSAEYVEDSLKLKGLPEKRDLADFGFRFIAKRFKDCNNELPTEFGAFVTKKHGVKLAESRNKLWDYFDELK